MFNEEIKSQFSNGDKKVIELFNITSKLELKLKKDLYEFNCDELEDVFKIGKFDSKYDLLRALSNIRNYFKWAMDRGYRFSNINVVDSLNPDDLYKFLVVK